MRRTADSNASGYTAKAEPGTEAYKALVAEPMMRAVDEMPSEWRELVHEFGYVNVYRAWRRRHSPSSVRAYAKVHGGVFELV